MKSEIWLAILLLITTAFSLWKYKKIPRNRLSTHHLGREIERQFELKFSGKKTQSQIALRES